jgi:hypothetical protein
MCDRRVQRKDACGDHGNGSRPFHLEPGDLRFDRTLNAWRSARVSFSNPLYPYLFTLKTILRTYLQPAVTKFHSFPKMLEF